jgi:hypothetical protein
MSLVSTELTDLCRIAARHDTDKAPWFTRVYDAFLREHRDEPLRLLEIGLFNGGSLRMWREYLPNAKLFGLDVDERCLDYELEVPDSMVRLIDQANPTDLELFVEESGGDFDFVLDDGGHTMIQQIVSFEVLFPHVRSGGVYVIEDVGTSYWLNYGGQRPGADGTTIAHLKTLVDAVHYDALTPPEWAESAALPTDIGRIRRDVASLHFHPGQAIIVKR